MDSIKSVSPPHLLSVNTGLASPLGSCRADLVDGWLVHAAALHCGLNTTLFPGQVLIVNDGLEVSNAAWAHGVPNNSRLSTASLVQDNRIRRDLVEARGLPVPQARTFSLGRGLSEALSYAESIQYPVVLKPMLNDSTTEVISPINSPEELQDAVEYFELVPFERPDFTAASYSVTQVMTPRSAGNRRTRSSYRFMVEKYVKGLYLRLLMIDGELVSVVQAPDGPWKPDAFEWGRETHSIISVAEKIWNSYPGLAVMAADIVVTDWSAEGTARDWFLVELSERPWLYLQHTIDAGAALKHAQALLAIECPPKKSQGSRGTLPKTQAFAFTWEGVSRTQTIMNEVKQASVSVGLNGWCEVKDEVDGTLGGQWEGEPSTVALINELAVEGTLLSEAIVCADLKIVPATGAETFDIRQTGGP